MSIRFGSSRKRVLLAAALAAVVSAILPASAQAGGSGGGGGGGYSGRADHWGVIARNTIGSPVAELRNGPFGSFGVTGEAARPPYGQGSLGIEVADDSTSLNPPSEAVEFGNEVDFYGDPVLGLTQVGFHVFQTGENASYGGSTPNMPNIKFEINPNVTAHPGTTYSTLVWTPPSPAAVDQWSPYMDATTTGSWFLTGNVTACTMATPCTFAQMKTALDDGGAAPVIYTAGVSKGRDFLWAGAVDGLRINACTYDFERSGVNALGRGCGGHE